MPRTAHPLRAARPDPRPPGSRRDGAGGGPGADWLTPAQTKQALKSAGYSEITKLEADDGHWDGEGIKDGRRMRFDADPKTGAILGEVPVE